MPELNGTILKNSSNLKAYYRFESGALTTDSSGNSHTLSAVSDPAETTGKFGGGVDLDGDDAYSFTKDAAFQPSGVFSLGGWIKYSGNQSNNGLFNYYGDNGSQVAGYLMIVLNDKLFFRTGTGTGNVDGTHYKSITGSTTLNTNTWRHVVAVYDGAALRVYVDGKMDGSVVWTAAPGYGGATQYARIGCRNSANSDTNFFTGSMDDWFLINGTALSADQIKELYEGRYYGELRPNQFGTIVGLWHLNGNSTDSSGNNNHGTDTAITYSQANGKFGQGADFNGSNGRIQVADSASLSITGNYTIGCWVNIDALPGTSVFFDLVNKYDVLSSGSSNTGYDFYLVNDSGTQKISLVHGRGAGAVFVEASHTLTIGEWTHLVGVYNGSTMKIFKNGAELSSANVTSNPLDNSKALNIGNFGYYTPSAGDLGRYLDGKLDEIFISSTALTATQIRQIYAYQKGLLGRFS